MLPFLFRHMELAAPEFLLLLGSPAARAVLATEHGVTRLRGRWHDWRGVPVVGDLPSGGGAARRDKKREVWADLLMLKARLDG